MSSPTPAARSTLRAVGLPAEHGGWGLTTEPVLLGLLVQPSRAGLALGGAALVAFLARTPLRVVLVDRHRDRHLDRTTVAARLLAVEVPVVLALVAVAGATATGSFWAPVVVAAPLVGLAFWYDARSRSRRLTPEMAGAVGMSLAATAITLAGGAEPALAWGLWLVLAARVLTAVPWVRDQVLGLHGRAGHPRLLAVTDLGALAVAAGAVALDPALAAGAAAVAGVVLIQRLMARRPVDRAVVLGLRELALGLAVVAVTALGVHLG